jgi:hypothetical protein
MHCQSLSRCCPYNPDCWRSKTIQQISSFTTQPYPSQLKVDNYNTSVRHSPHLVHQQNVLYALSSHFAMLSLRIDLLAFEDYTTCKLIHSPASPFTQPRLYIYNTSPSPSPLHQQTKTQSYRTFQMTLHEIRSSRSLYESPSIAASPPSRRRRTCQAQLAALLRSFFRSHSEQKAVDTRPPFNTEACVDQASVDQACVDQACVDQACVDQTRGELPGVTFHWRCCRNRRGSTHTFLTNTHFTCAKIWSEYGYDLVPSYHLIKCTKCHHQTCEKCIFLEAKVEGE